MAKEVLSISLSAVSVSLKPTGFVNDVPEGALLGKPGSDRLCSV